MFHHFEGETVDEVWRKAAACMISGESATLQNSRTGTTKELLHSVFAVRDPRQRWIVSRRPAINPAFAIVEVIWMLAGRNDTAVLNFWNRQLPQYAGNGSTYHGAYGYRLRRHFGIDQLDRAYQALRHNPDSRQVVLQIWDAQVDFPSETGSPVNPDIPCNVTSFLKVRDGKLEWMQVMRSNDLYRGIPYNVVQFTVIQEVLAGWLGVKVGAYHHLSDSLHLYSRDASNLSVGEQAVARNTDSISLPKADFDDVLLKLNTHIDYLSTDDLTVNDLQSSLASVDLPMSYQNLLSVVAAEAARRRGWIATAHETMAGCTNPVLQQLWNNWLERLLAQDQRQADVIARV